MFEKPAPTQVAIADLIAHRWSPRAIAPDQPVTGAASENLCLQATALSLVAHQMGGFDVDKARARFNIPADHGCMAMIAIGHPGPIDVLPDDLRDQELAPRSRKSLGQFAFEGGWGQGLQTGK